MMAVKLRESFAQIHSATKMQILFFYPSTVERSPEEENRQLEKLYYQVGLVHSPKATVNSGALSGVGSPGFNVFSTQPLRRNTPNYKRSKKNRTNERCETKGQEYITLNKADEYHGEPERGESQPDLKREN
jgi:hypothetical protein